MFKVECSVFVSNMTDRFVFLPVLVVRNAQPSSLITLGSKLVCVSVRLSPGERTSARHQNANRRDQPKKVGSRCRHTSPIILTSTIDIFIGLDIDIRSHTKVIMGLTSQLHFALLLISTLILEGSAFQPSRVAKILAHCASTVINEPRHQDSQRPTRSSATVLASTNYKGGGLTIFGSPSGNTSGRLYKDVVIVGGGLAGLSAAFYLSQLDPTRQVTILEKSEMLESPTGSFAAAGMLAPQSERLPKGDYLDLCMASKRMFPSFCQLVERLARESGSEGSPYLVQDPPDKSNTELEPWNVGYVAAGGFLAPAFAGDNVATWAPPDSSGSAVWLDALQVRELEPNLSNNVVGGWWFPEDASVDARRLVGSLKAACIGAGVQFLCGKNYEVSSLDLEEGKCNGLWLKTGKYIAAKSILVANGSWMRTLLPVPIEPHKGQSLSLRMPKDRPPILRRVLFAQDSYIVPKADGRIVIGATVEAGSYDGKVTPAGIMHILSYALELVPELADLPLEETWAGLRPTTPDKGPILGETPWANLYLAGGYWRNGVLLAPKTGELMASLIAGIPLDEQDKTFLKAFAWDRFTSPEGGVALAANARYAASLYPVHQRKSGVGVSAAVGTELGSYSTAKSAKEERRKDRASLWGDDDAFEKAAMMGKRDGSVFSFEGNNAAKQEKASGGNEVKMSTIPTTTEQLKKLDLPHFLDINPELESNATIQEELSSPPEATSGMDDLSKIYGDIRKNKASKSIELEESQVDSRPDPGFRVFHVDQQTGKHREVPPYTSPGEFLKSIAKETSKQSTSVQGKLPDTSPQQTTSTFDGYQVILEAAAKDQNIAETMRQARMKNRLDENEKNGAARDIHEEASESEATRSPNDISAIYERIQKVKAEKKNDLMEPIADNRPDPGFRIFHVNKQTGEPRVVPPYTSPGDFLASIATESQRDVGSNYSNLPNIPKNPGSNGAQQASPGGNYNEKTYDGYQDIISASSSLSEEGKAEAMREARKKNRFGTQKVDEGDLNF